MNYSDLSYFSNARAKGRFGKWVVNLHGSGKGGAEEVRIRTQWQ